MDRQRDARPATLIARRHHQGCWPPLRLSPREKTSRSFGRRAPECSGGRPRGAGRVCVPPAGRVCDTRKSSDTAVAVLGTGGVAMPSLQGG